MQNSKPLTHTLANSWENLSMLMRDKFQTSNPAKAALMYQLWLKGFYLSKDKIWKTQKWSQLKEESRRTFIRNLNLHSNHLENERDKLPGPAFIDV